MMDTLTKDSILLLRKMVAVPSESFREDEVCAILCDALTGWGIEHRKYGRNILAFNRHFDPSLPVLALDAHIDTVPVAEGYTRDPYDSGDDPSIVYGLGSNDDGGSVVSMIAVFRHFYNEKLPVNIALSLSCEEERSGPDGARWIYGADGPEDAALIRWVIIGEPTGMKAATSERGLLVLDAEARGTAGHAARNDGCNALYIALDDITALRSHKFARLSPLMGEVRLNVTQIEAGTAHNVIPDKCHFVVDIRPTEQYTNEEILEELQSICRSELKARNLKNHSSAVKPGSLLASAAEKLGLETFSSPTCSNWMVIGDRDAIKMGPGDSSRSHKADEFVLASEIARAIHVYIEFIDIFLWQHSGIKVPPQPLL